MQKLKFFLEPQTILRNSKCYNLYSCKTSCTSIIQYMFVHAKLYSDQSKYMNLLLYILDSSSFSILLFFSSKKISPLYSKNSGFFQVKLAMQLCAFTWLNANCFPWIYMRSHHLILTPFYEKDTFFSYFSLPLPQTLYFWKIDLWRWSNPHNHMEHSIFRFWARKTDLMWKEVTSHLVHGFHREKRIAHT